MFNYDCNWEKCRMTSVCLHLFPETHLTQILSLCCGRLSSRGCYFGPLMAFLRRSTGVPWVSLPGPTSVPQSPRWLCGKARTLLCVAWSRDIVCSVRSGSWSCFTLMCNWEYLHSCSTGSAVQALSRHHSQSFVPFAPKFLRVGSVLSNWTFLASCLQCRNPSCSRKMQLCFFLGRLINSGAHVSVLGSLCNLLDGRHAVLRVNNLVSLFNCR